MQQQIIKFIAIVFVVTTTLSIYAQRQNVSSLILEIDRNAPLNKLTKKEKKANWKLIFDGKSFKNWHGYNLAGIPDCWQIENGELIMITEGGGESQDIVTNKTYLNFAISLEFKLTSQANSGIIYQVVEDKKYKYPYETGPEYQIIDQGNWNSKLEDWQMTGANYSMNPPLSKPYREVGEWNQVLLVVSNNHVTHVLNSKIVAQYEKYSDEWIEKRNSGKWSNFPDYGISDEGHIAIQNHGTQVYYRNIKIKEL